MWLIPIHLLILISLASCGPRAVRSPGWILGQSSRFPPSLFIVGVGSAPTSANASEALNAAGMSARSEIAQTLEVQIQIVEELRVESESQSQYSDQSSWAFDAEMSSLSSYSRTYTNQIVQGI